MLMGRKGMSDVAPPEPHGEWSPGEGALLSLVGTGVNKTGLSDR